MRRVASTPRPDWYVHLERVGLDFHTKEDGSTYWNEAAYYEFSPREIDSLESATQVLDKLCLQAVDFIFNNDRLDDLQIPAQYHEFLRKSWETDEHTIYGRFDLMFDGQGPPKLLEFNADTPTSLVEAAVIQWEWLEQTQSHADQFNSIHEKLIEAWQRYKAEVPMAGPLCFSAIEGHDEDQLTVSYLRDTAIQAGLETAQLPVEQLSWNHTIRSFSGPNGRPITNIFKLYPWEWMMEEEFGQYLPQASTRWLEPPWKVLLSGKGLLPILWEMFPDHPNLLRAAWEPLDGTYVRKPARGREGANITIIDSGNAISETPGPYEGPFVYQEFQSPPRFESNTAVVGSWLVNGYACGIGVREDDGLITQNTSRFVPHVMRR